MAELDEILACWDVVPAAPRPELRPAGSPERTLTRTVVDTRDGETLVLEQIAPDLLERKVRIAATLEYLAAHGFPYAVGYRRPARAAVGASPVCDVRGTYWQVRPYVRGERLPRPAFGRDAWRGTALARTQIDLRQAATGLDNVVAPAPTFSWLDYVRGIGARLEERRPGIRTRLQPAVDFVERRLGDIYSALPLAFAHGDFHPLNVIWAQNGIRAVIDWEFCGLKPEAHDAALLLGCVGFDEPDHLLDDLAGAFLWHTGKAGLLGDASRKHLVDLVIAVRFGWLREWVFRNATSAIDLELDYFDLLMRHHDQLAREWSALLTDRTT